MRRKSRVFTALIQVKGYKKRFEASQWITKDGLKGARDIIQEQFSFLFDRRDYPRLPKNHTPKRKDIRIVWA